MTDGITKEEHGGARSSEATLQDTIAMHRIVVRMRFRLSSSSTMGLCASQNKIHRFEEQ